MIILDRPGPAEIIRTIAAHMKDLRRRRKISQRELAARSGVSYGSLRRFEATGEISLLSLSKLALQLGIEKELMQLFADVPYLTIDEVFHER